MCALLLTYESCIDQHNFVGSDTRHENASTDKDKQYKSNNLGNNGSQRRGCNFDSGREQGWEGKGNKETTKFNAKYAKN